MADPPTQHEMVGRIGTLILRCRGTAGPGEVELSIRGGREYFTAYCDEPLPAGATVLVIEVRPHRSVTVVQWQDPAGSSL